MKQLEYVYIWTTFVVFFTLSQAFAASGGQTSYLGDPYGNTPPYVTMDDDFSLSLYQPETICFSATADDLDFDIADISVNFGYYDDATNRVCFFADTTGEYTLILTAMDSSGATDSDTTIVTVAMAGAVNSTPVVSGMPDSTLYLCYPREVCLPVDIFDPDGDIDSIWVNRGWYEDGQVCFIPYDSGHYELIVTAIDSSGNVGADTAVVFIQTDKGISLECPGDTTIFTCQLVDTFCFPIVIHGAPDNIGVDVWGINTWYTPLTDSTGEVCFWSGCSIENRITVHIYTPCDTLSCEFTVTVKCNSSPLVILPPDITVPSCEGAEICLPVGISDADDNLVDVIVQGGSYDPVTSTVCFTADTVGTYIIQVTAEDSCEATDSDVIAVTVMFNNPPYISYDLPDTISSQCAPEEICLPIEAGDIDGNLDTVIASLGFYDVQTGELCFTPDTAGRYCIRIIAYDLCGLTDTADVCITIETGDFVQIDCPTLSEPIDIVLCEPGQACYPLDIVGDSFQVQTSYGTWENGQLCFQADTSGLYNIQVFAVAECNSDTCDIDFDVHISDTVMISCPLDKNVVLCQLDTTFCFIYVATQNADSVTASPPAYIIGTQVCVPVLEAGDQTITMIAAGACGADTCTFTVTAQFNSPPVVDAGDDTTFTLCGLSEICIPFSASDVDTNIAQITSSLGYVDSNQICFTPPDFGTHLIVITAIDECGAADSDTVAVTVNPGGAVAIICPQGTKTDTICGPDTICVPVEITPEDVQVTVLPDGYYDPVNDEVCVPVDQGGTYDITVIAEAFCDSDTCQFTLEVQQFQPPVISCPQQIDTVLCLVEPVTLCYPVSVSGDVSQVTVSPIGSYAAGQVCIPVDTAGTYLIEIAADGLCGTDTCVTTIQVGADQAPELFLPGYQLVERCLDDTDLVCIDGIYAENLESIVTLTMTCGAGNFQLAAIDSGEVCFLPDSVGVYEFCFEASDGCNSTTGSFFVEILEKDDCGVCVKLSLDAGGCIPVGINKDVDLHIETNDPIGGFDILLNFDASAVEFLSATISGTTIDGWEFFDWRLDPVNSGLLRLIGIADISNGAQHPPDSTLTPNGLFIHMQFRVANDQNLGGLFLPINFLWYDCGDNTFSDPSGSDLYLDLRIFNPEMILIWDEEDDINYPEAARPFGLGAPDICTEGGGPGKPVPIRCIEFINGGICIIPAESLDVRGDVNLNGVPYEIADAVMFTNYFIYGLSVFRINQAGQVAATDVNADGLTLSVADLVFLIRVITGDADPIPKLEPYSELLILSSNYDAGVFSITTDAVSTIGAALLVYDISGDLSLDQPHLAPDAQEMDLAYAVTDGQLRMLIYSFGTKMFAAGANKLVEIPYQGDGELNLAHAEIVDYQGRPYTIAGKQTQLPTGFTLNQNYPNPFNPITTISFSLPYPVDWSLRIYNITGGLVREYFGLGEAGTITVEWDGKTVDVMPVASGVYFYRLDAADFTDTKKMILLK